MFSVTKAIPITLLLCAPVALPAGPVPFRVCADPNNMPYSSRQQQGFENRLAEIVAKDLGRSLSYAWFPQRENFFDKTLNAGVCDAVMSVPAGFDDVTATEPYYRSSYVFVSRRDRGLDVTSFDDPRLRSRKIGVQILGDGDDNLPPVFALNSRGIIRNVQGFSIFGKRLDSSNPQQDLINAVVEGKIDIAVAWGPMAGYFAKRAVAPLTITPVGRDSAHPDLPLAFDIAIGVRKGNQPLERQLNATLLRRRLEIQRMLRSYGLPTADAAQPTPQEN
jgi:mxaJ protein